MKLVGLDTGLAEFGCSVANDIETVPVIASSEVWRTFPDKSKRRIRKADVTSQRARELARRLNVVLADKEVVAVCVEAVALPFRRVQLSVVSNLGRIRGVVDALCEVYGLPIIEETPQALKQLLTGRKDTSKEEMRAAIEARFPGVEKLWPPQKGLVEHAADSIAPIVAGLQSDVVQAAIRARGSMSGPGYAVRTMTEAEAREFAKLSVRPA